MKVSSCVQGDKGTGNFQHGKEITQIEEGSQISLESVDCGKIFVSLKKPRNQRDQRILAFQIIYALDCSDYLVSIEEILSEFKRSFNLTLAENSFALQIANGVVDERTVFDEKLKYYLLNWDFSRLSNTVRIVLYQAFWELFTFKKTPTKTIIDEYVEIVKCFGETDSFRIVNGILDKIAKEQENCFVQPNLAFRQTQQSG